MVRGSALVTMPPCAKHRPTLKQDHVARGRRLDDPRALEQEAKVTFLVAVQHPVARIGARVERFDEAKVAIDADQDHGAVDAVRP